MATHKHIEEMQSLVEQYIYDKKGVNVSIDIEGAAMVMPRGLAIPYLNRQLILLNAAYDIAYAHFNK